MNQQKTKTAQPQTKQIADHLLKNKKGVIKRMGEKLLNENKNSHCGHTDHFVNSPL